MSDTQNCTSCVCQITSLTSLSATLHVLHLSLLITGRRTDKSTTKERSDHNSVIFMWERFFSCGQPVVFGNLNNLNSESKYLNIVAGLVGKSKLRGCVNIWPIFSVIKSSTSKTVQNYFAFVPEFLKLISCLCFLSFTMSRRGNNVKLVMHQISVDKIENPCY